MAKTISLDPEVLRSQSSAMTKLKNDYEDLFSNITKTLNETNNNWSNNLANNFVGKISSAQKSFSMIVTDLGKGAEAAKNSADTMQNIDIELSKQMSDGNADSKGAKKSGENSSGKSKKNNDEKTNAKAKYEKILKEGYEALPKDVRKYLEKRGADIKNLDKWLAENYDTLPDSVRENIEKLIPGTFKDVITITREIASGKADYGTLLKASNLIAGEKLKGSALYGVLRAFTWEDLEDVNTILDYNAAEGAERFLKGDYLGTLASVSKSVVGLTGKVEETILKSAYYMGEGLVYDVSLYEPIKLVSSVVPVDNAVKVVSGVTDKISTAVSNLFK